MNLSGSLGQAPSYPNYTPQTISPPSSTQGPAWDTLKTADSQFFPPYFRPTTSVLPKSTDSYRAANLPIGFVVAPGNLRDVEVADLSQSRTIRCNSCEAYLCPWFELNEKYNSMKCPICGTESIITTRGIKISERPEAKSRIIDLIAPQTFVHNGKTGPSFLFAIDTSYDSISCGFTQLVAKSLEASLKSLSDDTYVNLVTFSTNITMYDLIKKRSYVYYELDSISHIKQEIKLGECRENLASLLHCIAESKLPAEKPQFTGNCYGSALDAALICLEEIGGIIMAFVYNRPTIGPHNILPRSKDVAKDARLMLRINNSENSQFYRNVAKIFQKKAISCHLFAASSGDPVDLGTIAVTCGLTGGRAHFYGLFKEADQLRLHRDIFDTITREYYWDCTLRLRTTRELHLKQIYGNYMTIDHNVVSIPILGSEDTLAFEYEIDGHLTKSVAVAQFALVFTDNQRRRMIRLFTFSMMATHDVGNIYKHIDETALITMIERRAVMAMLKNGPGDGRESVKADAYRCLTKTKTLEASPHFAKGLISNPIFNKNWDRTTDDRMAEVVELRRMDITQSCLYAHPRIVDLNGQTLRAMGPTPQGVVLIHCWDRIYIWGKMPEDVLNLIGSHSVNQYDHSIDHDDLIGEDGAILRQQIDVCWTMSGRFLPVIALTGYESYQQFLFENKTIQ